MDGQRYSNINLMGNNSSSASKPSRGCCWERPSGANSGLITGDCTDDFPATLAAASCFDSPEWQLFNQTDELDEQNKLKTAQLIAALAARFVNDDQGPSPKHTGDADQDTAHSSARNIFDACRAQAASDTALSLHRISKVRCPACEYCQTVIMCIGAHCRPPCHARKCQRGDDASGHCCEPSDNRRRLAWEHGRPGVHYRHILLTWSKQSIHLCRRLR